jgi:hypothetical protein
MLCSAGCFYLLVSFVAFTITCCIHYFSVISDSCRDLSYECGVCDRNDNSQSLTTQEAKYYSTASDTHADRESR